ncbi:MAG: ribosome maturation factor RimP [Acutalibacteraceae bacterium]
MINTSKGGQIAEIVRRISYPIAQNLGLELWDIKFVKEGPNRYLRVFIDKPEGVTLEDCENMSRALDAPLDELDPIPVSYCLEVCSPGIERELSTDSHLKKFIGSEINIKLIRPNSNNEKFLTGKLKNFDKDNIYIEIPEEFAISRKSISHINLKY